MSDVNPLDPLLKEFEDKHSPLPDEDKTGVSEGMADHELVPTNEEEKFLLDWRHSMHADGIDLSIGISSKKIYLNNGQTMVRVYTSTTHMNKKFPAIVYYHGGGFIGGSIYVTEGFIKLLAQYTNSMVFSVDYHYAPEYKATETIFEATHVLGDIFEKSEELGIDTQNVTVFGRVLVPI